MSTYFAILTEVGEAKLANAIALGQTLKLKSLAVGDGNGNLPMPVRTQKALVHEVRRAGLNQLTIDPANTSQIIVEQVLPEDVGGWWIREIGIFDEAGDLCAVANCPPSYKPLMAEGSGRTQVVRIVLIVASTAAIELKIDPSIILATRKYVDDQGIIVRAYSDAQLAKHLAAADPHPLLAKVAYVDQQDGKVAVYADQQLAKHQAALDPHPLLAKVAYVDQQDTSTRAYGDQQLAKHQAAVDPHPLLAKVTYVDQEDTNTRAYGDQQLGRHQAAADPHPLLAKVAYVDQEDTNTRAYGDQQLGRHQAAADPHPLLAKVAYVDQQDTSARAYGDQQLAKHLSAADPHPLLAKVAYVDQQDASARTYGDQQLAKHQAAADPHPLLAQRSHVDQQDSSIVAYGEQQLAKHAAAADPHPQYSMKEVATLPRFDASKKLANTEFVQQSQGNIIAHDAVAGSRSLTPVDIGKALYFSEPNLIFTLPKPSDLGLQTNSGKCIHFFGFGGNTAKIVPGEGANISFTVGGVPFIEFKTGQYLTLTAASDVTWQVIESTAELWRNADFSSKLAASSGHQKLPGNFIMQFGDATATPAGNSIAFDIAFPVECFGVCLTGANSDAVNRLGTGKPSRTGFTAYSSDSTPATRYIAIGK
ncbi:phage tail protein [Janthinobacterium sp. SUN073]|uniref:phage tail protein n=1 Tax=Janthinobacterium sp. SUN073 TaxID=3004102 RepID=UPI0025AF1468|nr:phage tail protein [Janthinobacterium sp. SUN073]MDN2695081.1 phage tail protein [Janthinobacterium sp. SUN073]